MKVVTERVLKLRMPLSGYKYTMQWRMGHRCRGGLMVNNDIVMMQSYCGHHLAS